MIYLYIYLGLGLLFFLAKIEEVNKKQIVFIALLGLLFGGFIILIILVLKTLALLVGVVRQIIAEKDAK